MTDEKNPATIPQTAEPEEGLPKIAGARVSPFISLCAMGFLGRLSYEMARSPLTSLYAKYLGAPVQVIGLLVAAVTITGIFVKLPAGSLADLFGFRRLMLAGLLVKATAPFLYLPLWTWPQLLAVRFYHGLSTALYAPAASALVAKSYPNERARHLGIYSAAENAGVTLGPVIAASILSRFSFTIAFLVSGVIGIVALLIILPFPRDRPAPVSRQHTGGVLPTLIHGLRQIIKDPAIRLVSLMEATLYMGVGTLQAYLPLYALTAHVSVAQIGLLFGAQGGASIFSRPIMGAAADRLGRRPFIAAGVALCAAVLIAVPHVSGFGSLLALSTVFGLGTAMVTPSTTAMIGDLTKGGEFGAAMGVFGSLWDIGHASGPLIAGVLIAALGYSHAFAIIAAVIIAALVVFIIGSNRQHIR